MPVGRIILKTISGSKKMASLKTDGARLLYTWLIPHLDVNGCFSGDPVVLNGQVFTRLNKSNDTVTSYLDDLENNGCVVRYEANGDVFLIVPDFKERQPSLNPEREGKTTIPLPGPEQLRSNSGSTPTQSNLIQVNRKEIYDVFFDEQFWPTYPPRKGRKLHQEKARQIVYRIKKEDLPLLLQAVKNYAAETDPEFVKDAFRWLKDDNWRAFVGKVEPTESTYEGPPIMTMAQIEAWHRGEYDT